MLVTVASLLVPALVSQVVHAAPSQYKPHHNHHQYEVQKVNLLGHKKPVYGMPVVGWPGRGGEDEGEGGKPKFPGFPRPRPGGDDEDEGDDDDDEDAPKTPRPRPGDDDDEGDEDEGDEDNGEGDEDNGEGDEDNGEGDEDEDDGGDEDEGDEDEGGNDDNDEDDTPGPRPRPSKPIGGAPIPTIGAPKPGKPTPAPTRPAPGGPTVGVPKPGNPAPAPVPVPAPAPTKPAPKPTPSAPTGGAPIPGNIKNLPANLKFDYQIGGAYTPAKDVQVVTRDHSEDPVKGLYNICYVNAFQTQPEEASFWKSKHPNALLKKGSGYFEDPDWPGEMFLDTSTDAKRQELATVINGWIDDCAKKGFNAIEPDNLDTFSRSNGLLTKANNLALAKLFTDHAHSLGLAVAQKNTGEELGSDGKSVAGFDFAVAEECQQYKECNNYTDVYGDKVLEIEYTDGGAAAFKTACDAQGKQISVILRDRDVTPSGSGAYSYKEC